MGKLGRQSEAINAALGARGAGQLARSSGAAPRLILQGISKRYGDVIANEGVDLSVAAGEIHALLGENGAGKSTLMKIVYGVTEPDAGSDVKGIRTVARRDGDSYVLDGAKMFITNGVHGDLICVAAKTDRSGPPSRAISMFLVEKGTPGFTVSRALDKHGWRSSDTAELHFEACRIPAENRLGEEGRGFHAIMRNFQNERTVIGAMAMGEAQAAIELTLEYVRTRRAFGAPLWQKQAIRQRLAMLAAKVEAGRQLVYHAAWLDAQGIDATKEVSMVKAYCGELVNEVMYDCLQFHGGMGFMRESTIERMARDARVQAIGGGATEVMLEEVAKRL